VCKELETHTRIEEQISYPAVQALNDPELNDQVREALSEHAKVKDEVARLRATKGDGEDVDDRMSQLEKDVEHHASEEENEMFPRLEDLMPDEQREDLGRQMQAMKRAGSAQARPRPASTKKTATRARTRDRSGPAARSKTSQTTKSRAQKGKRKRTGAPKRSTAARTAGNKRSTARKRTKRAAGRGKAGGRR
jgi:hemerythrin superfamily protein